MTPLQEITRQALLDCGMATETIVEPVKELIGNLSHMTPGKFTLKLDVMPPHQNGVSAAFSQFDPQAFSVEYEQHLDYARQRCWEWAFDMMVQVYLRMVIPADKYILFKASTKNVQQTESKTTPGTALGK